MNYRGFGAPALAAQVKAAKCYCALSVYRQQEQFQPIEVEISRHDMANWGIVVARQLMPLLNRFRSEICSAGCVGIDESTM